MFAAVLIVIVLGCALSLVTTTLRVGISPMPSSRQAATAMLDLVDTSGKKTIIDLGSGWGSLVFPASARFPDRQVTGYEVSWIPWAFSRTMQILLRRRNLTLIREDFLEAELPETGILLCYLFPGGMKQLETKLHASPACRLLIVSHVFALPSTPPDEVIQLNDLYRSPIYLYRWDQRLAQELPPAPKPRLHVSASPSSKLRAKSESPTAS